jgi:transposase
MDTPLHGKRVHLIVKRQRFACQVCEKTFQQVLPDMDEKRNMTIRLLGYIRRLSLEKKFTEIAEEVGVNEKTVRNVFREHVETLDEEHQITAPEWLGVDEQKLIGDFRCIFTAPGEKGILDLLPKMDKATVLKWMMRLPNRENVKVVTLDMHRAYREAANSALPNAQCVVDKFHVVRMANAAADSLRIAMKDDLDPTTRRKIKRDRWIIKSRIHKLKAADVMMLRSWDAIIPGLAKAYRAKEDFFDIYDKAVDRNEALELWDYWKELLPDELKLAFKPLVTAVENWKPEIFAYFDHRGKTNAYTEAMNGLTRKIEQSGRGYSFDAIRAKVLYGGKKRATDTEYVKIRLAMKIKRPKGERIPDVEPPPKRHREKRIREK